MTYNARTITKEWLLLSTPATLGPGLEPSLHLRNGASFSILPFLYLDSLLFLKNTLSPHKRFQDRWIMTNFTGQIPSSATSTRYRLHLTRIIPSPASIALSTVHGRFQPFTVGSPRV